MTTEVLAGLPTGTAVPEPGQLVRIRSRRWVATNVERSTEGGEPDELSRGPEHLVTLVSVDDDAFGEELRVIWELELGSAVLDRSVLPSPDPERFDDPRSLGAFLDAVRWGRSPAPTPAPCRRPSAAASRSRTTSSTRWSRPCPCPGSTCWWPTTSAASP